MLKTQRLTISPITKEDLKFFQKLRNNPDTSYYLTNMLPINDYMQEEWFRKLGLDATKMYFSLKNRENIDIGLIRCDEWDKINRSIRVGVDIVGGERKKGYAIECFHALLPYLFFNLSLHRIWLLVAEYNTPARNLYKKVGFVEEGIQKDAIYRDGQFHDYIMMSILKSDYEKIHTT